MEQIDTDGIAALLGLFAQELAAWKLAPRAEAEDVVVKGLERELFGRPAGTLAAEGTDRRERLLALAERLGVSVGRHPDRDDMLLRQRVWFRGVSTGDAAYEDVSLAIALAKWLLMRNSIEAPDSRIVALAMRLWIRTAGAGTG